MSRLRKSVASLVYRVGGLDVFGAFRWLTSSEGWSADARRKWRVDRLNRILGFAWDHVPFYQEFWRDHGLKPRLIREIAELERYPIVTKTTYRANAERFIPDNIGSIRHRTWHTGGTTGEPVRYLRDLEQWTINEGFHLWGWSRAGYSFGDRVGVIAGGSLLPNSSSLSGRLRARLHNRVFLFGVSMDDATAESYCRILERERVQYVYGYPSILYLFARSVRGLGLTPPNLRGIVTTGEMLLPQYRSGIEETFGCHVTNNLGCNDGGYQAYECPTSGLLHYNDLQSVLETDRSLGETEGSLLITNLWNRSTPFIRYENGDLVELGEADCACGCGFETIRKVQGRTGDILEFSNGQSLGVPALTLIFKEMDIDSWQVVQTKSNELEIRLCTPNDISANSAHVRSVLRNHLNDDVRVSIVRVDELERTAGGKWTPVWRKIRIQP